MRSNLFSKGALAAIVAAPLVLVGCGGDSITGSRPGEGCSALGRLDASIVFEQLSYWIQCTRFNA